MKFDYEGQTLFSKAISLSQSEVREAIMTALQQQDLSSLVNHDKSLRKKNPESWNLSPLASAIENGFNISMNQLEVEKRVFNKNTLFMHYLFGGTVETADLMAGENKKDDPKKIFNIFRLIGLLDGDLKENIKKEVFSKVNYRMFGEDSYNFSRPTFYMHKHESKSALEKLILKTLPKIVMKKYFEVIKEFEKEAKQK